MKQNKEGRWCLALAKSTYLPGCWQAIVMACNPTCTDLQIPEHKPS
jgi:hypothetical protein